MNLLMQMAYVQTVGVDTLVQGFEDHVRTVDRSRVRGSLGRWFRRLADRVDPEPAALTGC